MQQAVITSNLPHEKQPLPFESDFHAHSTSLFVSLATGSPGKGRKTAFTAFKLLDQSGLTLTVLYPHPNIQVRVLLTACPAGDGTNTQPQSTHHALGQELIKFE